MSKIYLTGCTHFDHSNVIKFASRPFSNVDEMNKALLDNWNSTVNPEDTVYHLGDFFWKPSVADEYRLNGNIIKLQGNHDRNNWGNDYVQFKYKGVGVNLFHYPIEEWDGWYKGSTHFHCHTHGHEFVTGVRRGNVGVDSCNYKPIWIEEAIERVT